MATAAMGQTCHMMLRFGCFTWASASISCFLLNARLPPHLRCSQTAQNLLRISNLPPKPHKNNLSRFYSLKLGPKLH